MGATLEFHNLINTTMTIQSEIFDSAYKASEIERGSKGQEKLYKKLEDILNGRNGKKIPCDPGQELLLAISTLTSYQPSANSEDVSRRKELAKKLVSLVDTESLSDENHLNTFSGVINNRGQSADPQIYVEVIGAMIAAGFDPKKTDPSGTKDAFQVAAEQSGGNSQTGHPVDVAVSILLLRSGRVNGLEGALAEKAILAINSGSLRLRDIAVEGEGCTIRSFEGRRTLVESVAIASSTTAETLKKEKSAVCTVS